jgi:hypothetical protein
VAIDEDGSPVVQVERDGVPQVVGRFGMGEEAEQVARDLNRPAEAETSGQDSRPPTPDSWESLLDHPTRDDPEPPAHYWQMQHRPAQTPDGQPLGVALFVTEFPDLPPDFNAHVERDGMDDSMYPSRARTLEMAHFTDVGEARRFETEFRQYLIPGVMDGPELAPEVAKLEGLSGAWQDLTEREIIESMEPNRAVVREPHDWHPHNPNAEREAQARFENPTQELEI